MSDAIFLLASSIDKDFMALPAGFASSPLSLRVHRNRAAVSLARCGAILEDGASTRAVLQAADRALISSRQAGRNGVAVGEAISSETLPQGG